MSARHAETQRAKRAGFLKGPLGTALPYLAMRVRKRRLQAIDVSHLVPRNPILNRHRQ